MNKDKMKDPAKKERGEAKAGKETGDKSRRTAGPADKIDESTKKGLGKTEDKIRDQLKG